MKMKYIYLMAVLFGAASLYSCSGSDDVTNASEKGLVPVTLQLPGNYDGVTSRTTPAFDKTTIKTLEKGSTLWLFATTGGTTTRQGYIIKTDTKGVKALYPCGEKTGSVANTVDIDTLNVETTPLYLTPAQYTFKAISPALTVYSGNKFKILNGDTVVATNNYWTQTAQTTVDLSTKKEGVVVLNPMMEVGSLMTFTIKKTDLISSLSLIQSGIEIDGLGAEMDASTYYSVGDSLVAKIGNPYNQLYLAPSKFTKLSDGSMYSRLGFLPVNCNSTMIYVVVNLMVNAVPVQYTFALKNRVFRAGYSYNYLITIDVKDGITVANWQENSWTYDAKPE